jgi:mRNA interferase RelE/StbE
MASYKIEFSRSAEKDLRRLDHSMIPRIMSAVEDLASDPRPHGVRKLVGSESTYRIRVGDYRLIYDVFDRLCIVGIERIRHRKEVYE